MDDVYDCRDDILDLADRVPENLRREDRNVSKPLKRPRNDSRSPSRDRSMDRSDPRMSKPSGRNNSPNTFRSGPRSRSPSRDSNNRRRSVSSRDSDDRRRSSGSFKGGRSPSVTRGQLSSRPARSRSPMKSTDMLRNSFSRSPVGSRDDQPKFGDSFKKLTQDIAASTTGRPSSNWSGDQNDRKKLSPNKRDSFSRSRDDDRSDRDRNQSRPRDIRIERAGNYSDGPSKYRNDTWTKDRSRSRDRSENTHMERNAGFKVPNTRRRPSRSPDDERFSNTSGVTNAVSHQQHTAGSARGSESSSGLESGQIRSQSESGQLRSQTETMSGSEQQRVEVPTAGTARKSRSTLVASQRADKYTPLTRPVWHCYTLRKRG